MKTADISWHHHWFPHKMTSEKLGHKFPYCWLDTTQTWVVMCHQYRISTLVSLTSFCVETSDGVMKCQLFSQAIEYMAQNIFLYSLVALRVHNLNIIMSQVYIPGTLWEISCHLHAHAYIYINMKCRSSSC